MYQPRPFAASGAQVALRTSHNADGVSVWGLRARGRHTKTGHRMAADDVAAYYDELHRWTAKDKGFQVFSGFENDTIHRFLIDEATGAFSPDTIYKFIDPHIKAVGAPRGLDAGCGYGGTVFRCLKVHGGRWTGITISQEQVDYARGIAKARGVARGVGPAAEFYLLSYDAPLPGRYNVMVAIESLIHSADPAKTIANLASALEPGGRLVVVDDMPLDDVPERDRALLGDFKRAWRCPITPSASGWIAVAQRAGLRLMERIDLSHLMKPRAEADLDAALADLSSQRAGKTEQGFGRLSDAEIGGLHLERLLGRGTVRYVMLVFRR
ncbi:MAG: methyltransferase domain-containing protein [Alphaproteobacteria bacterium]|nr:methyltransferase domain-containing protein [Alphaproteobacteria bacterium]